ncbi:hypothetical protein BBC05_04835 [Serratia sp. ISTD04]|nr:hypothetical protein BBC05_04835 [Serratia sp. ISTD04]PKR37668.1 hypothetical protein CU560_03830 [Serratia ureilytica]
MILFWLQPNRGIAQYDIITNIIARDLQCQQLSGGDGLSIQFVIQFFQQPGAQYAPLSVERVGGHTDALAGKQAMDDVTKSLGLRHTDFRNEAGCPHPINMSQRSQNASLGKRHELLRQAGRHRMWRNANAIRFRVKVIERRRTGAIAGKKQMDHAMNVGMLWNILCGKPVFMGNIAISGPILTHQCPLMIRQSRVIGLKGHAVRARDQQRRRVMWGTEQVTQAGFGRLLA